MSQLQDSCFFFLLRTNVSLNLKVMTLLKKQTEIIKKNTNVISKKLEISGAQRTSITKFAGGNASKKSQMDKKAVNLAPTISNLKSEDVDKDNIDIDDGDSRDDDLVIDMGEDEECESRNENEPENGKYNSSRSLYWIITY